MTKIHFDVLVIGAGISGISAAYYLQTQCPNKTYAILEGRENFGGTWDFFKYPGIRSDSDMYTLGFKFHPWTDPKIIADAPTIMTYLQDTLDTYGIDKNIRYNQYVESASWSSEEALWTITTKPNAAGESTTYTCNFLSMCTGYYDYENGFTPDFKGRDSFQGQVIHPQKWNPSTNYDNKKIVVIGSGATAVTLVPELAKKAQHVTMLQRSPTYIIAAPDQNKIANFLNKILPTKIAHSLNRWRIILFNSFTYWLSRTYPERIKKFFIGEVQKQLEEKFDAKHFTPSYKPWDQRVCLVPNGDLFKSIKSEKASVITDHIDQFIPTGILLKSGEKLDADIIVTATGLNIKILSGIQFTIDGKKINTSDKVAYRSMMFSDVPNLAVAFGYTNASWTLKVDMSNQYVCRLINYMDEKGYQICTPKQNDPNLEFEPFMNFTSSYVQRNLHLFPKAGNRTPWKLKQNYLFDRMILQNGKLEDGVMEFSKVGKISKGVKEKVVQH